MKNKKKAQVEIVGLLIIVILVVIVVSLVMKFKVSEKPRQIQKDYMHDQMSTSFLLTLLRSNTQCSGEITFEEAFQNCANHQTISCPGYSGVCDYLNGSIKGILNQTLNVWEIGYKFMIGHHNFDSFNFENSFDPNLVAGTSPYQISMWPQRSSIIMNLSISR